jgi:hypothetical protein
MKVNCGTVLRTRMNIDDFAFETWMRPPFNLHAGQASGPQIYF